MNELVSVQFYGDQIEATRDQDQVIWVPLKRICENLGLSYSGQYERVSDSSRTTWATIRVMRMVAEDGKNRETFCLHIDSVPMWLATIDACRVKGEVRPKLALYQKECAQVLRNHFLGGPQPALDPVLVAKALESINALSGVVATIGKVVSNIDARVTALEEAQAQSNCQVNIKVNPSPAGDPAPVPQPKFVPIRTYLGSRHGSDTLGKQPMRSIGVDVSRWMHTHGRPSVRTSSPVKRNLLVNAYLEPDLDRYFAELHLRKENRSEPKVRQTTFFDLPHFARN